MENRQKIEVVNDSFPIPELPISLEMFDNLLAKGWRLLGDEFVRHSVVPGKNGYDLTVPLRVRLADGIRFSKSQRQLLAKNSSRFRCEINRIRLSEEKFQLFQLHAQRFAGDPNQPKFWDFLNECSDEFPVPGLEFDLFDGSRLVACSFLHLGSLGISATYCFHDPEYHKHSLGIYSMLLEILYGVHTGRQFYYPGYAYAVPSRMDYKKNFYNLEQYDWRTLHWWPAERNFRQ